MKGQSFKLMVKDFKEKFGSLTSSQLDFFLENNLPKHYNAKEKLAKGLGEWRDLKWYSDVAKIYNDHEFYERSIRIVAGKDVLLSPLDESSFIGVGGGFYSLNSYRKVCFDGGVYFEKVFMSGSSDLARVKYFYDHFAGYLSNYFVIPSMFFEDSGKVAVLYFDWVDSRSIKQKDLFEFYRKFREVVLSFDVSKLVYDDVIFSFSAETIYSEGRKGAAKWLREKKQEGESVFSEIESYVENCPVHKRVVVHGDIRAEHIKVDGSIIDFDRFGVYPDGYDLAFLLSRHSGYSSVEKLMQDASFFFDVEDVEKRLFFLFFVFIFYFRKNSEECSEVFFSQVYDSIVDDFLFLANPVRA